MKKIKLVSFTFLGLILFSNYASAQGRNDYVALHRLYNSQTGDHLYTTDCREKDDAVRSSGYVYESVAGYVATRQARRTAPLYRLLLGSGEHFYTSDQNEVNDLTRDSGNRSEGIVGYLSDRQERNTAPFYRLLTGERHLYTADEREKNNLLGDSANRLEESPGYIWTTGRNNCDSFGGNGSIGGDYPVIYSKTDFTGESKILKENWNVNDNWSGDPHTIRAIRVPSGWYVALYTRGNYRGRSFLMSNDAVFTTDNEWYDNIGSIKISKGKPPR